MNQNIVKAGQQQAKKLLVIQALVIVLITSVGLFKEFKVAIALLSGGMAVLIANFYFVYKAFSRSGARANKQVVRAFYLGETVKIILSASLLIIGFKILPGYEIYVLAGYLTLLLSQWLAPAIIKTS